MKALIHQILAEGGVKGSKLEALADAIAAAIPQTSSGSHPSYTENGITYIWCSRHQEYHPAQYMVPNKSKESGYANYCKPAQRKWEWMHKHAQLLTSAVASLYQLGKNDEASTLYFLSQTLAKEKNNQPYQYKNIDIDMSIEDVVASCVNQFYTNDIKNIIPEHLHKMLGLAPKKVK